MAQMTSLARLIPALLALAFAGSVQAQDTALDAQARAHMAAGQSATALALMREHVAAHPDDRAARLDLVRYLTWNGDYAHAEAMLRADPEAADSAEGQGLHAALLAWAGRLEGAQAENAPALQANADDFFANYTQALALRQTHRPDQATPFVAAVQRLHPGSKDARDLERGTWVRTASFVAFDLGRSSDSTDLVGWRPSLVGDFALRDGLRLTAELARWAYRAPVSSPYSAINGDAQVWENRALVGLRYAPNGRTEFHGAIGQSSIPGDRTSLWRAGVDHHASDDWRFDVDLDRDRVDVSARAVSLGLTRVGGQVQAHWTPDLNWTGDLLLRRDQYSDHNNRDEIQIALRRAVVRRPGFMLDLGAAVQHFGFDRDPGHGYYSPDNYRRYSLTGSAYVAMGENAGLMLQGGLGRQRDENFTAWRSANDLSAEFVVGIFSPWELRLRAGYSQRVQNAGAYEGRSWGARLTRRF